MVDIPPANIFAKPLPSYQSVNLKFLSSLVELEIVLTPLQRGRIILSRHFSIL